MLVSVCGADEATELATGLRDCGFQTSAPASLDLPVFLHLAFHIVSLSRRIRLSFTLLLLWPCSAILRLVACFPTIPTTSLGSSARSLVLVTLNHFFHTHLQTSVASLTLGTRLPIFCSPLFSRRVTDRTGAFRAHAHSVRCGACGLHLPASLSNRHEVSDGSSQVVSRLHTRLSTLVSRCSTRMRSDGICIRPYPTSHGLL